jgi:hypothetical protein
VTLLLFGSGQFIRWRQPLSPDSDPMRFHNQQPAFVVTHFGARRQIAQQALHQRRNHLGMISDLESDDAFVCGRRIGHNVGKVTVQRHQNGIQFLRLSDDDRIIGILRNVLLEDKHFMAGIAKGLDHRAGDTVVGEES